jgi:hypothetical protein
MATVIQPSRPTRACSTRLWAHCAAWLCGLLTATIAHAAPVQLPAQGRLTAAGGGAVSDGTYAIAVALYDQADAATAVFEEVFMAVPVQGGVFTVTLGTAKFVLDDKLFAGGGPLWVGVTVGADELPRLPLRRVPFAVQSSYAAVAADLQCSGCVGSGDLEDGSVTAAKIAAGAVQAQHVAFNWALGDAPGGAANFALSANNAKLADAAVFADEAAVAQKIQCTGCVNTNQLAEGAVMTMQLANGAVTSVKLAPGAVQWGAIAGTPAGFADGVDDTVTDSAIVTAVQKAPLNLAKGLQIGGVPAGRIATLANDNLADKAAMTLDTGSGSLAVLAQAWFYDGVAKSWLQANSSAAGAATCNDCGSGVDGVYNPQSNTTLATTKKYQFTDFIIPKGVTVTVTGTAALEIKASKKVQIDGVLLLDGGNAVDTTPGSNGCSPNTGASGAGAAGPGGWAGASTIYGNNSAANGAGPGGGTGAGNGIGYGNGGGGGGAGHATSGSAGALAGPTSSQQPGGAGGGTYISIDTGLLQGGSGGGAGGYGSAYNSGGAGGGGGGGAVKIEAPIITVSGSISAKGGKGGAMLGGCDGGAGGGGSGGAIWLRGASVQLTGATITAVGGAGGAMDTPAGSDGGVGGAGGNGRVRIDCPGTVAGTTTPAFTTGSTTGITLPSVNAFSLEQPQPGVVRLTNLSGQPQKVQLVVGY